MVVEERSQMSATGNAAEKVAARTTSKTKPSSARPSAGRPRRAMRRSSCQNRYIADSVTDRRTQRNDLPLSADEERPKQRHKRRLAAEIGAFRAARKQHKSGDQVKNPKGD